MGLFSMGRSFLLGFLLVMSWGVSGFAWVPVDFQEQCDPGVSVVDDGFLRQRAGRYQVGNRDWENVELRYLGRGHFVTSWRGSGGGYWTCAPGSNLCELQSPSVQCRYERILLCSEEVLLYVNNCNGNGTRTQVYNRAP